MRPLDEERHRERDVRDRAGDGPGLRDEKLLPVAEQARGEVCVRQTPAGGLEPVDAAEVCRDSRAAPEVAREPERGASRRDDRTLTAAASARCPVQVPGVEAPTVDAVVALPPRERLEDVRLAEDHRTGLAQLRDERALVVVDLPDLVLRAERRLRSDDPVLLLDRHGHPV